MKNILIISDYSKINGGAAKVAIQTAVGLAKLNYNVYFFAGDSSPCEELIKYKNIKCINLCLPDLLSGSKCYMFFTGIYNKKVKDSLLILLNSLELKDTRILVHSWTKVLSPSIFSVLAKKNTKFYITCHDYFLNCPNGGFF